MINTGLKIESNFKRDDNENKGFDSFMYHYLTIKNIWHDEDKSLHENFQKLELDTKNIEDIYKVISEVHTYSNYYVRMVLKQEVNEKLKEAFIDLNVYFKKLEVDAAYPFLLKVYDDFENELINEDTFIEILKLIESYICRRYLCSLLTDALNKALNRVFRKSYRLIDKDNYLESVQTIFVLLSSQGRFPDDIEFKQELKIKDLYSTKTSEFWLYRIENYNREELVNFERYTIEHIMPQSPTEEWQEILGENWKERYNNYLHTIGNLTLTRHNQELGNKSFKEKKKILVESNDGSLRLNKSLQGFDEWNEESIQERTEILSNIMVDIWPYPSLTDAMLKKQESFIKKKTGKKIKNIFNF